MREKYFGNNLDYVNIIYENMETKKRYFVMYKRVSS